MDYVVISDIHLGHDVYVLHGPQQEARIELINKNLSIFIDRQTARSVQMRKPCTLVVLGDFIDFCKASFDYSDDDKRDLDWDEAAVQDGLPVTERNMAW